MKSPLQSFMSTMSKPKHLAVALVCALAFTGCDKKGDVISNAAQADPKVGIAATLLLGALCAEWWLRRRMGLA
jgi:uncharacterized membrane protein